MIDQASKPDSAKLSRQQRKAIKATAKALQNPDESPEDRRSYLAHLRASLAFHAEVEAFIENGASDERQLPRLKPAPLFNRLENWSPLIVNGGTSYPAKSAMFRRQPFPTTEDQPEPRAISQDFESFIRGKPKEPKA